MRRTAATAARMSARWAMWAVAAAVVTVAGIAPAAWGDFDVKVDLENLSGEAKANWPVVMTVYQVLGRDLPAGAVNPKGFHVYDEAGKELEWAMEELPPFLHPGGDELIFVVPKMDKGQKLTYRITNTAQSGKGVKLELAATPHNLIKNGTFEEGDGKAAPGFTGGAIDSQTKRSGKNALLLAGKGGMKVPYAEKIPLHVGSYYYAGVWSKTVNVARYGTAAGRGGYFTMTGLGTVNNAGVSIAPTCYTRDWNKLRLFARYTLGRTDWGVERSTAQATEDAMTLEIGLDQKKQFHMENDGAGQWWLDDLVVLEQPKVAVRFDLLLEPLMKDGYFVFTRPTSTPTGEEQSTEKDAKKVQEWVAMPFPHEAATKIDRFGLKGQRVPYLLMLYQTRPMQQVQLKLDPLLTAGGDKLVIEAIDFSYGNVPGDKPHDYLMPMDQPVDFKDKGLRHLLATVRIPRDAKAGKYSGKLVLSEGGKAIQEVPVTLAVQDAEQAVIKDRYIGSIFQSPNPVFTEETITQFGRSGFSCVTIFGGFLKYKEGPDKLQHVELDDLALKMGWLRQNGFAAVSLYSELQLDDKPRGPGRMAGMAYREGAANSPPELKKAYEDAKAARQKAQEELNAAKEAAKAEGAGQADQAAVVAKDAALKVAAAAEAKAADAMQEPVKKAYFRLIKELDDAVGAHADWPRIIHMNWDEPGGGVPKMGWTNECLPHVLTTLDAGFGALPSCLKYYNMPAIDDPADHSGPDTYAWLKRNGKKIGFAASGRRDEFARYQVGVLVAGADLSYVHSWHVKGLMATFADDKKQKHTYRYLSVVGAGEGMDDLKAYTLLTQAIAKARAGSDAALKAKADEADAFLKKTFDVWNGDHAQASGNPPYFGLACYWGYERFYDDLQKQMARYAVELLGAKWVE